MDDKSIFCYASSTFSIEFDFKKINSEPSLIYILTELYRNYLVNDRFGSLNDGSEFYMCGRKDNIFNIQSYIGTEFKNMCEWRIKEILNISYSENKPIYIMWSGGCDSTLIVSLFGMFLDRNKRKDIIILYDYTGIEKYPQFFNKIVKDGFSVLDTKNDYNKIIEPSSKGILVSGFNGDEIIFNRFGYNNSFNDSKISYKDKFRRIANSLGCYKNVDFYLNDIENYSKLLGIDIFSFSDLFYMFEFGCKYSIQKEKLNATLSNPENHIAFFDTNYFNSYWYYSYYTRERNFYYRLEWKKIIYEYSKDDWYFLDKNKGIGYICSYQMDSGFFIKDNLGYHHFYRELNENIGNYYKKMIPIIKKYVKPEYKNCIKLYYFPYIKWLNFRKIPIM